MVWKPAPLPGESDPKPVGDSLPAVTKRFGLAKPSTLTVIFAQWPEVVGVPLANHAKPVGLRDGKLTVEVDEPAWATQLRFLRDDLLARLNEAAGAGSVVDVVVRVAGANAVRGRRPSARSRGHFDSVATVDAEGNSAPISEADLEADFTRNVPVEEPSSIRPETRRKTKAKPRRSDPNF